MKRMTYNNLMKAIKMIQAKGNTWNESESMARHAFDTCKANGYSMPVEWHIDKIMTKADYDKAYGM